jgi:organic radical activating enzyme
MIIKELKDEDFVNYKKPSMFVGFPSCNFKCCKEGNFPIDICQNCTLMKSKDIHIDVSQIVDRYLGNPITSAIVCGGMEPMDSWNDLSDLIKQLRQKTDDDIVVYTGFYPSELEDKIGWLKQYKNIIIKFGRFMPNHQKHYDDVLGVWLASNNQHAERIS